MDLDLLVKENFIMFTATELMVAVDTISLATVFRKIPTWSSLNALIFISRINDETRVLISTDDLIKSETIDDIYQLIEKRFNGVK